MDGLGITSICGLAGSTLFCTYKWLAVAATHKKNVVKYAILGFFYSSFLLGLSLFILALTIIYGVEPFYKISGAPYAYRISILSTAVTLQVIASFFSQKFLLKRFSAKETDSLDDIGNHDEP